MRALWSGTILNFNRQGRGGADGDGTTNFADITAVLQYSGEVESANISRSGVSSIGYGGGY